MEFAAIDFETTGYENGEKNEPWQLGLALVRDGAVVETREWFFGTALTPDAQPIFDQWDDFAPHLIGRRLVAHNIATERTILTRLAPLTKWGPWVDTLKLARARYPKLPRRVHPRVEQVVVHQHEDVRSGDPLQRKGEHLAPTEALAGGDDAVEAVRGSSSVAVARLPYRH